MPIEVAAEVAPEGATKMTEKVLTLKVFWMLVSTWEICFQLTGSAWKQLTSSALHLLRGVTIFS
jgi:hypothetical protein